MAETNFPLDIELIKRRAVAGVITFTVRTFFVQIFSQLAFFALTIALSPSVFGVFFLVSAFINFFVYFSDIGLAAALIQKKENPTKEDLETTFTIQQVLILTLVIVGLIFSRNIANFYNLDQEGLMLLRAIIISLLFSSLKTIPSIILERNLNFTRLVIPQVLENLVFYSVAVILAFKNFQVSSFTYAVIARGLVGLIAVYILAPWKPSLSFNIQSAKKLTAFGIPFQLNSILALIKDDLLTVFIGKILPIGQVGLIGWSQKLAFVPLRFFMDNVNKVTFPAYSRLQEHPQELVKAIEKAIFFVTFLVYPCVFGIMAIAPALVNLIPAYDKWAAGLPLLYLFSINALFSCVSTTFTNTLFAIGKPKIVLNFMIFWTAAIWILTIPLVGSFGYIGVGIASALVSATSVFLIYFLKKEINVSILSSIIGPLVASIATYVAAKSILYVFPLSVFSLILAVIAGAIIYAVLSITVFRHRLLKDTATIFKSILNK